MQEQLIQAHLKECLVYTNPLQVPSARAPSVSNVVLSTSGAHEAC